MTSLQNSIAEQITSSVSLAMEAVKHSIAEQISEKMEEAVKKSKEELEIASFQLGGRIDRTRENIEGAMSGHPPRTGEVSRGNTGNACISTNPTQSQ